MEDHNEVQSTSKENQHNCIDRIPTHFLVELTSLDELAFPANSTKRVKYTCVASTSKCLCLGTSTGTVYIFSRYAAKSRSRTSSPVPVQVFTTRDGQISTISISPSEELMAIGGDSGRVSVAQFNNGQPPTLVFTTPGDARAPDKVTALAWSPDLKTAYSGHSSGALYCHRLASRSVFRQSHQKLTKFEGNIVQLDTLQSHILVATSLAAHLYHVDSGGIQQVGTKSRTTPAPLGACYIKNDEGGSAFIVAARPNGRLWEANLVGVVYKTHQYRQSRQIPRAPPISFRCAFPCDPAQFDGLHPDNQDVALYKIRVIQVEDADSSSPDRKSQKLFIVSTYGSRICVVEMETSRVICVTELDYDILDVSTCANDVFVLLADSKGLRKFSVFNRLRSIEKLNSKSYFVQSSQAILFSAQFFSYPAHLISKTIEGLSNMSKKKETERLQSMLQNILDEQKASQSMYDNNLEEMERRELVKKVKRAKKYVNDDGIGGKEQKMSKKLPSGVYKVLQTVQCSGYDDDFSFSTPQALRERSRSSPCGPESPTQLPQPIRKGIGKRASEPSSLEVRQEYWRQNGTPDVVEEDILHRARQILEESSEKLVEKESLRTLLQLEGIKKDEIRFTPTVTIGNAAKALAELALAVPVDLSTIWNKEDVTEVSEKSDKSGASTSTKKPTIVKVVRPGQRTTKEKPIATVAPTVTPISIAADDIVVGNDDLAVNNGTAVFPTSDDMRRKQDEMWLELRLSHIMKQSYHDNQDQTPRGTVPKSDTDYTLTTESGGPTPSDHVWRNPLTEEIYDDVTTPTPHYEASTSSSDSKSQSMLSDLNCTVCGMHQSWAAASVLMAVCHSCDVIRDDFAAHGSIPTNPAEWTRLLRNAAWAADLKDEAICPKCEMSLSSVERVCNDGWRSGVIEEGIRPNSQRIFERCLNTSREKLEAILAKREMRVEVLKPVKNEENLQKCLQNGNSIDKMCPDLQKPDETVKNSMNHPDSNDFSSNAAYLRWTQAVPLKTLLALCVFTIGKKATIQIISADDQWIAKRMQPQDWCAIVVMGTRETTFKDLLGIKTITSVLDSVGATGWVTPRKKQIIATSSSPSSRKGASFMSNTSSLNSGSLTAATALSSWIVDTNGKCPVCTLPIKMVANGADRGVASYYCGHVYHKICLAGRYTTGCIACLVRARRAARTASSATSSPTSSPIMSPRHQKFG